MARPLTSRLKKTSSLRGEVWQKFWKSLQAQFNSPEFKPGKDRLVLHLGVVQPWHGSLKDMRKRAETSKAVSGLEQKRPSMTQEDVLGD